MPDEKVLPSEDAGSGDAVRAGFVDPEHVKLIEHELGERFRNEEPLSKHSTLRIGGPAAWWAEVETLEELRRICQFARKGQYELVVVGLGSNTLFPDEGLDAVVVRLAGDFARWQIESVDGERAVVSVGAGVINAHLVRGLHREGFTDMEFLSLIPGTFGGAVVMNAGTREKELSSIIRRIELSSPDEPGKVDVLNSDSIQMRYRHTELPAGSIVTGGAIDVTRGDVDEAAERVRSDKERRNQTQPYRLASVGSTFANPAGDYAGRLIEAAGLKGHRIGGAKISELHANFFINDGDATAEDFLRLMALTRVRVRERFGVELSPEVRFVGFDGWERLRRLEQELEEQGC